MKKRLRLFAFFAVVAASSLGTLLQAAEAPYQVAWSRQLGTTDWDSSYSVAVDGTGNVLISGSTEGSLDGANAGESDAFLAKYDSAGNWQWSRQLGTSSPDASWSVAVDGSGNAFISGWTDGSLDGASAGGRDAFLSKYDSGGNLEWTQQLGTSSDEESWSVAVDGSGNAFISGWTYGVLGGASAGDRDAFLSKYDSGGNWQWSRQLGTSSWNYSRSVAVDGAGNAFISGRTFGSLGGPSEGLDDAFLAKYDSSGSLQWTRQLGTSMFDDSYSVIVDDAGNAFISGYTYGSLGGPRAGSWDAFLAKYDTAGNLQWTQQLGTSSSDSSYSVAVDGAGNAFICGRTRGSLGGENAGDWDAFLAKYDSAGNLLWTQQLGTLSEDVGFSVAIDSAGNAFISGWTYGGLGGENAGGADAFLVKFVLTDFSANGALDADDLMMLFDARGTAEFKYDLNADGAVDNDDAEMWITDFYETAITDFDLDYDTDVNDLNIWKANRFQFGKMFLEGDADFDNDVDVNDLNLWKANRFQTHAAAATTTPEPATLSLLALGGLALLRRRRSN